MVFSPELLESCAAVECTLQEFVDSSYAVYDIVVIVFKSEPELGDSGKEGYFRGL